MFGPAGLPAEAVETLDRELAKILARPEVKARFPRRRQRGAVEGTGGIFRLREGLSS